MITCCVLIIIKTKLCGFVSENERDEYLLLNFIVCDQK